MEWCVDGTCGAVVRCIRVWVVDGTGGVVEVAEVSNAVGVPLWDVRLRVKGWVSSLFDCGNWFSCQRDPEVIEEVRKMC